jgi:hypothetical protein
VVQFPTRAGSFFLAITFTPVAHLASLGPASFQDLMRTEYETDHAPPSTGVDKIMEALRNCGIEFVLATLKELQLATLTVLLPFVCTL